MLLYKNYLNEITSEVYMKGALVRYWNIVKNGYRNGTFDIVSPKVSRKQYILHLLRERMFLIFHFCTFIVLLCSLQVHEYIFVM